MNLMKLILDLANEATAVVASVSNPVTANAGLVTATTAILIDLGVPASQAPLDAQVVADAVEEADGSQNGPGDLTNDIEALLIQRKINLPPTVLLILASVLSNLLTQLQAKIHPGK